MNATVDTLRGELERLFTLEDLTHMSEHLLGLDPTEMGGREAKSTFARILAERCVTADRVEALVDVMVFNKKKVDEKVYEAVAQHGREQLEIGRTFGPFAIVRVVDDSELSFVADCTCDGKRLVLKVLKRIAMADRRAVQRFLTVNRLIAGLNHPGFPNDLRAGEFDGCAYIAYEALDGELLSVRAARTGPQHFQELRETLRSALEPLVVLHNHGLVHGDLTTDHVVVDRAGKARLVDFGGDKLRAQVGALSGANRDDSKAYRMIAPEIVCGMPADARSDVYAFGAMVSELLSGKTSSAVGRSRAEARAGLHDEVSPSTPPSSRAPRGWVTHELDAWILSMMDNDPARRPKDATEVLAAFDALGKGASATAMMTPATFESLTATLMADPCSAEAALELERSLAAGADPALAGHAFVAAADLVKDDTDEQLAARKALLYRAARAFNGPAMQSALAEGVYARILATDPTDDVARTTLEALRRKLGKHDDLIEMLLERGQLAASEVTRADAYAEIGSVYLHELDDSEQALVAYTQALCEMPNRAVYAQELERLCGAHSERWNSTLETLVAAIQSASGTNRIALTLRTAEWYDVKVGRSDMALLAFQQVLQAEPANDTSLQGLAGIYRRAEQWPELLATLNARADAATSNPKARDYRVEAAELLETKLSDARRARELYERVYADDPGHAKAFDALIRLTERQGDFEALVKLHKERVEGQQGVEKASALVRLAQVYEDHLGEMLEATSRYETALSFDPKNQGALKGLDRTYNRLGRYRELLDILERQVLCAATPRQKVALYERIGALHEEEFLDHAKAALALEALLRLDRSHDLALTGLVRHLRAQERWDAVVATYDRHLAILSDEHRIVDVLLAKARVLADRIGSPESAIGVYERVLGLRPGHPGALEALAQLREVSGDSQAAVLAIEALAGKAETPEARAEQWLRAGRLLETRGDRDAAIERYRFAIDAHPRSPLAAKALRRAYQERGDAGSLAGLIERELLSAETDSHRARLHAELATLHRDKLGDLTKAEASAAHALELEPSNVEALSVLGDIAFDTSRFLDAATHYDALVGMLPALQEGERIRVLGRFIEAFGRTHVVQAPFSGADGLSSPPPPSTHPKLQAAVLQLFALSGANTKAMAHAANTVFKHGDPRLVLRVYQELFAQHDDGLAGAERVEALYHLGEAARRSAEFVQAVTPLRAALEIDPNHDLSLRALSRIYEETGDWEESIMMRARRLDSADSAERFNLFIEMGDLEFHKLSDRARAEKTYSKALQERPDDRKLLARLMQLYSEEKDWGKLVEVVSKLAEFVDDEKQRAKYMHTAATIASKHLQQPDRAIGFYLRALEQDPSLVKAADEALALLHAKPDFTRMEQLLQAQVDYARDAGDPLQIGKLLDRLGDLYRVDLADSEAAIDAYEAAEVLEPEVRERIEKLALLYASEPKRYLTKAVHSQTILLRSNPYRVESYQTLRRLYTESKKADSAWCLCQALAALHLADPGEARFFAKHRSSDAAAAQSVLDESDWKLLSHAEVDPLLTRVFALIQPVVIAARTHSLQALGYGAQSEIDPARHPAAMPQTLYYAAGVLGMTNVRVFQNPNEARALAHIHSAEPAILLGRDAFATTASTQTLAFLAGQHFAAFRPGAYVNHLVATGTGLKAWLFGAIRFCVPSFPIAQDLAGAVAESMQAMMAMMPAQQKDSLTSAVSKLLQSGDAIDLKRWASGIELTADRVGLLLCHDLQLATEAIRGQTQERALTAKERVKELVLFSVSEEYFALRQKMRIAIDS